MLSRTLLPSFFSATSPVASARTRRYFLPATLGSGIKRLLVSPFPSAIGAVLPEASTWLPEQETISTVATDGAASTHGSMFEIWKLIPPAANDADFTVRSGDERNEALQL